MTFRRILVMVVSIPAVAGAQRPTRAPTPATAQRCPVLEIEFRPTARLNSVKNPATGNYNLFIGGGGIANCRAQQLTLSADSVEYFQDQGLLNLIGNVHYREPRASVDSRRMTYWQTEERILADGDVVATQPNGTTMRGPQAEYFREIPNVRRARLTANGRPTVKLVQKDSTGKTAEPVDLVANQVVMDGDSLVYAGGSVEITRSDVLATADSAALDSGREFGRLIGHPRIEGRQGRPFRLTGETIDLFSKQRKLERVVAQPNARTVSEDVDLTADSIDLRVVDNHLSRAIAWGKSRAHVVSPAREIIADSIDMLMPAQKLQEVHAVRRAVAETDPDTVRIRSGVRDRLEGDTIVAFFDTTVVRDTSARARSDSAKGSRIKSLTARGNARSLYQIASREGPPERPGINYVTGRTIDVAFSAGQVQDVRVIGDASGVYLEPSTDSTARPAAALPTSGASGATPTLPVTPPVPPRSRPRPRPPAELRRE